MVESLRYSHGYRGDAKVYYLIPKVYCLIPRSQPPIGLVNIEGPEEVNQMVIAHAYERTKICHLYVVNRPDSANDGDFNIHGFDFPGVSIVSSSQKSNEYNHCPSINVITFNELVMQDKGDMESGGSWEYNVESN